MRLESVEESDSIGLSRSSNYGAEAKQEAATEIVRAPSETTEEQPLEVDDQDDLDWDGPGDIDNPRNWSMFQRILHSAIPAIYGFALTIGTSTFVSAVPYVQAKFQVGRTVALLPISLYTVGFTLGPLIAAPISEVYGRRMVYWINLPLLVIFNAAAAESNSMAGINVLRLLAGVGGSGVLAVGGGTIVDIWEPKHAGPVSISYILAPFLGPTLGPLVGAFVVAEHDGDWKWTIWIILLIYAPVAFALVFMKETSKSRILYLRARQRGGGNKTANRQTFGQVLSKVGSAMLRPLHMVVLEPLAFFLSLYTAFSFAMIFSFFGSYSYVYTLVYRFNPKEVGLAYLGIVVGFILALATFGYFDAKKYRPLIVATGNKVAPEHRLYAAMFGSVLLPVGLFWFAWAPQRGVPWIVPVLAGVPFGWGALAVFLASITYLVETYGVENGASAIAANGVLRFLLGAVFPLFTVQMYQNLGIHWAGTLFAFISVAMVPVPWVFFWKGKTLRRRSHYRTNPN